MPDQIHWSDWVKPNETGIAIDPSEVVVVSVTRYVNVTLAPAATRIGEPGDSAAWPFAYLTTWMPGFVP